MDFRDAMRLAGKMLRTRLHLKKKKKRSGRRLKEINVVTLDGVMISCKRTLISETRRTLAKVDDARGALFQNTSFRQVLFY